MSDRTLSAPFPSFSIVAGGACARALRATGSRFPDAAPSVAKVALALVLLTWCPLLVATLAEGTALGGPGAFANDVGVHARLLLALPLGIVAELPIGWRLARAIRYLDEAGIICDENRGRASAAVRRAERLLDLPWLEAGLALVALALSVVNLEVGARLPTWVFPGDGEVSSAGWIYLVFSAPVFRFIALRWLWRLVVWAVLLTGLARSPLRVNPAHPDRAGGLAYLVDAHSCFAWIALALGVSLAGNLSTEKLLLGRSVTDYTTELLVFATVAPLVLLAPLWALAFGLERARRGHLAHYGSAAAEYARRYTREVIEPASRSPLAIDTERTSAHADLSTSFDTVRGTRALLPAKRPFQRLFAAAALPMLVFMLQEVPLLALLHRVKDTIG
ncbi:MAG TPA: hypothetical protein VIL20_04295 [Sandaracinaceae bacterium]